MDIPVPEDDERCRRTGSPRWRCPERVLPGRTLCQKHYLLSVARQLRLKNAHLEDKRKRESLSSMSAVEPYRPVIDFDYLENPFQTRSQPGFNWDDEIAFNEASSGDGNDGIALGEVGRASSKPEVWTDGELRFESKDGIVLGEWGEVEGNGGNEGFALAVPRVGSSGVDVRDDYNAPIGGGVGSGKKRSEAQFSDVYGEMESEQKGGMGGEQVWKFSEMVANSVGIESKCSQVGSQEKVGQGQKRKRGRPKGSKKKKEVVDDQDEVNKQIEKRVRQLFESDDEQDDVFDAKNEE